MQGIHHIFPAPQSTGTFICQNFPSDALFNPYYFEDNTNNIGDADSEDPEALAERETWAPYSKRLISCNYEQPDSISKTKEGELRTLTLNIRSVIKEYLTNKRQYGFLQ